MESVYPDRADIDSHAGEFLLRTRGLRKVYDGRAVVNGVDVTVRPGETVANIAICLIHQKLPIMVL